MTTPYITSSFRRRKEQLICVREMLASLNQFLLALQKMRRSYEAEPMFNLFLGEIKVGLFHLHENYALAELAPLCARIRGYLDSTVVSWGKIPREFYPDERFGCAAFGLADAPGDLVVTAVAGYFDKVNELPCNDIIRISDSEKGIDGYYYVDSVTGSGAVLNLTCLAGVVAIDPGATDTKMHITVLTRLAP